MRYFVKLAGKAFGPLEEEKIVEMYQTGRLKYPVEISRDKKVWDSIDIILPNASSPDPDPNPVPDLPSDELLVEDLDLIPVSGDFPVYSDPNAPVWFYSSDGSNGYGPVTKSELATMLQCNMLNSSSLVWQEGENSRLISDVPELVDILSSGRVAGSSAGYRDFSSVPDNSNNYAYSPNSVQSYGYGTRPGLTGSRSNSNANMFDLLDDPSYGNDGLGQGRAYDQSQVGQTSRMSYVLMAIFFGQLGIHNFYASRMDIAIIQLFVGLSNLVGLIIISFVSMAVEGDTRFLFIIPALIAIGLELWAIIESCVITHDGTGRLMY